MFVGAQKERPCVSRVPIRKRKNSPLVFWDAHIHLFPQPLFRAIWRWFDDYGWGIPYANWELEEYIEYLKGMGVERGYLLTYAHKPDMSLDLNKWAKDICKRHPFLIPFACIHPDDSNLDQVIATTMDDWGFAGFKLQLAVQQFPADHPGLAPIYLAALERGKPVIIHTGTAPYPPGSPHLGLSHMERVLAKWPALKVVIPHLGFNEFDEALSLVSEYPNVYLDTSWVLGNPKVDLPLETLVDFMERYPDRFLYGSDFPILEWPAEGSLKSLLELGLSKDTQDKVLVKNARRLVN